MSTPSDGNDWSIVAASTRPVRIAGTDHLTALTREALEGVVPQVRDGFVTVSVEHLDFLPPIGKWTDAQVVPATDGAYELVMVGRRLSHRLSDATELADLGGLPTSFAPDHLAAALHVERRNFDDEAFEELRRGSPFELVEEQKWSQLPPLIWTLAVPVSWGACKFAGAFFETLGKGSAEAFVRWLGEAWRRTKHPDRDRILSLRFESGNTVVYGFALSTKDGSTAAHLVASLNKATDLAAFAGLCRDSEQLTHLRRVAFIFDGDEWRLAWWATGEEVCRTRWFDANVPDPERFLGREVRDYLPVAGEEPAHDLQRAQSQPPLNDR